MGQEFLLMHNNASPYKTLLVSATLRDNSSLELVGYLVHVPTKIFESITRKIC